jgi:hypothetical protein
MDQQGIQYFHDKDKNDSYKGAGKSTSCLSE